MSPSNALELTDEPADTDAEFLRRALSIFNRSWADADNHRLVTRSSGLGTHSPAQLLIVVLH